MIGINDAKEPTNPMLGLASVLIQELTKFFESYSIHSTILKIYSGLKNNLATQSKILTLGKTLVS